MLGGRSAVGVINVPVDFRVKRYVTIKTCELEDVICLIKGLHHGVADKVPVFSASANLCPSPSCSSNFPTLNYCEDITWAVLTLCFESRFIKQLVQTVFLVVLDCLALIVAMYLIVWL